MIIQDLGHRTRGGMSGTVIVTGIGFRNGIFAATAVSAKTVMEEVACIPYHRDMTIQTFFGTLQGFVKLLTKKYLTD